MLRRSRTGAEGMKTLRRFKWLVLGGVVAVLILAAFAGVLPSLHGEAKKEPVAAKTPREVVVTVAPVTTRTMRRSVEVVGTLEGHEEINLSPKVEGRVVR